METFNQSVLSTLLEARHLTLKGVSERMGVSETELKSVIGNNPRPNVKLINDLSHQLSVPSFVFFMDAAPSIISALVDFRQSIPTEVPKLLPTVKAISLAQRLQEVAIELGHLDTAPRNLAADHIKTVEYANGLRAQLGITASIQIEAEDSRAFYALCRAAIERLGIFVLHESFPSDDGSGFCLAQGSARVIVINTKDQNHSRRNFTLLHEMAHALIEQSGVSDPFVTDNAVERSCNLFAARFLAPKSLVKTAFDKYGGVTDLTPDQVYRCANFLNISQEATIVRLEQLKFVTMGSHRKWLAAIRATGNPDFGKKGGGGGNVPQEKVKLAKYGFTFAKVFGRAVKNGKLSPLDLYRMSGLKPKYQSPYFNFASSAGPADAED